VVPKLGSAAPQGAVKDFQGPQGPGQKKNSLRHNHNLLTSSHWCFKLETRFSNNFQTFYTLIFQKRGLRRFRRVSRHDFKKLSTF
ncbi:hypothetical protein WDU94_012690, partial [Cyamophila willieti]